MERDIFMGSYADILKKEGVTVPEHKREEFKKRVEQLFQAGGMMEIKYIQLCDRKVNTIKKASMHEDGMDFIYNYFENDRWENAGFDAKECRVYSNKIGWRHFRMAIVAAYVLETMYLDGPSNPMIDNNFISPHICVEWPNYLFHENFAVKNNDSWKSFEAMHEQEDEQEFKRISHRDWEDFVKDECGLLGYVENALFMLSKRGHLTQYLREV